MTLDVVVQILKCGIGPVYLSGLCLFAATAFIFAGIGILAPKRSTWRVGCSNAKVTPPG